jgi:hypothetical protein
LAPGQIDRQFELSAVKARLEPLKQLKRYKQGTTEEGRGRELWQSVKVVVKLRRAAKGERQRRAALPLIGDQ